MTTTPYSVSISKGSMSYNNYVNTPILGPLSTNQYPTTIPYHSNGTLTGLRPTPPQFYPSQEPVYAQMNTNARQQYLRTAQSTQALIAQREIGKQTNPIAYYSNNRKYPTSTHANYIAPIQSSMYLNIKKSNAIGKSSYKVGLPTEAPISTKNYYPSGTRSSIRRARSGGCVAPKKKGAIQNTSLNYWVNKI